MSKKKILEENPELELTDYGDFVIRKELVDGYEIIDFHTHTFSSIAGSLPALFRREAQDTRASFFDLSCYPGDESFFCLDKVGYRTWTESLFTFRGIKAYIDILGLSGVIPLIQKASEKRLLRDMQAGSVDRAVVLPINWQYVETTQTLLKNVSDKASLLPFGSIHPYEEDVESKIETYRARGILGFKVNPHVQKVDFDDEKMIKLLKLLAKTLLPIISCSGLALPKHIAQQLPKSFQQNIETQNLARYEKVLSSIPEITFIFAHGGLEQNDKVIELMKKFPNTYTDISTQPSANIRRLIGEIGSHRILFGSDYPFFNQAMPILSVLKATDNHDIREAIYSKNARRLLHLDD